MQHLKPHRRSIPIDMLGCTAFVRAKKRELAKGSPGEAEQPTKKVKNNLAVAHLLK